MSGHAPLAGLDWIAVDWGTSALRAWAMDGEGSVLAKAQSQDGMGRLSPEGYEPALQALIQDWLPAETASLVPVIICGMAGAKQGWKEAAYRQTPCPPVAGGALTIVPVEDPRLAVSIVPGLCQMDPPDVMRGEETQLAGLCAQLGAAEATVCLPGTHSKWVRLEKGEVAGFSTFMTGELFSVIASHSILRHSVGSDGDDTDAFTKAVCEMLVNPAGLTGVLFGIRASGLLVGMDAAAARSRLSGLLIGAELAATRHQWVGQKVHLIGAGPLVGSYATALEIAGAQSVREDVDALTLAGLSQVRAKMKEVKQ